MSESIPPPYPLFNEREVAPGKHRLACREERPQHPRPACQMSFLSELLKDIVQDCKGMQERQVVSHVWGERRVQPILDHCHETCRLQASAQNLQTGPGIAYFLKGD